MPRESRHPVILNELLTIKASSIMSKAKDGPSMILRWYSRGEQVAGMRCLVEQKDGETLVHFMYHSNVGPEHIQIHISTTPSNLGIGLIPFFVCPITGQRSRKLYLIGGKLASRHAIKGALYDCKIWSKKYRELNKTFGKAFQLDGLYDKLHAPYFKQTYRGKATSTYNRLVDQINKIESLSL